MIEEWESIPGYEGYEVSNFGNMRFTNLVWETPKENHNRKREHVTLLYGERVGNSKLKDYEIQEIRQLYLIGYGTQEVLAEKYNVSVNHINRIINYRS